MDESISGAIVSVVCGAYAPTNELTSMSVLTRERSRRTQAALLVYRPDGNSEPASKAGQAEQACAADSRPKLIIQHEHDAQRFTEQIKIITVKIFNHKLFI